MHIQQNLSFPNLHIFLLHWLNNQKNIIKMKCIFDLFRNFIILWFCKMQICLVSNWSDHAKVLIYILLVIKIVFLKCGIQINLIMPCPRIYIYLAHTHCIKWAWSWIWRNFYILCDTLRVTHLEIFFFF